MITLIAFAVYLVLDELYFSEFRLQLQAFITQSGVRHILAYSVFGLPLFVAVLLIHPPSKFVESLGLNGSLRKEIGFPLIATLPMLIGYAIVFDFNAELTLTDFLISAVAAAFFEELYFRGFLFGQLFRFTRLGFLPSVILGAIIFGLIHLYQSHDLLSTMGIFTITFIGAILFAWLYAEWQFNLWIPIFLHFFMNLFWMLFAAGDTALGGLYANIFRFTTIAIVIIGTIYYKRKMKIPLSVNRTSIWLKK